MESTYVQKTKRLEWIDSLRGLASVLVAIFHLWQYLKLRYVKEINILVNKFVSLFIDDFLDLGKIGVVTFFIVSGYVMSYSFKRRGLKAFIISKFFRLYPAYWVSLILFVAVEKYSNTFQLLINFTMLQKFFGFNDLVGVYWTLQIELIFYFLCSVLFFYQLLENVAFLKKITVLLLILSLSVALLRFILEKKLPVALFLGLDIMFLGLLIEKSIIEEIIPKKFMQKFAGLFAIVLLIVCLLAYNKDYGYNETWYRYYVSYIAGFILFYLFYKYKINKIILNFFGKISYSLYLLHPVLGLSLTSHILNMESLNGFDHIYYYILLYWTLSIMGSFFCYKFIEKRFIDFSKSVFGN